MKQEAFFVVRYNDKTYSTYKIVSGPHWDYEVAWEVNMKFRGKHYFDALQYDTKQLIMSFEELVSERD